MTRTRKIVKKINKSKIAKRVRKPLRNIDNFNVGSFGKKTSIKNASIFTAPGLKKAVDMDRKRRKDLMM